MYKYPLSEQTIHEISEIKEEPLWVLNKRLEAYKIFLQKPLPTWGVDLSTLDFTQIQYFTPTQSTKHKWSDVPEGIIKDFERIGVPGRERKYLAGVSTQYDSGVIYHRLKDRFSKYGIIFESIENGLKMYPELFKKYFGTLITSEDNKFAALNTAFWSGGSFVYIPKGINLEIPIETYFRINAKALGQFERTLIIADKGSFVHYIEGCTAPQYLESSLHSAVVEIFAMKGATVKYTTLQNWSKNVYNLVTKRALTEENAHVEWVDCNIGSRYTMKYPSVVLKGDNSSGKLISLALASENQNIDSGGKMIHIGRGTKSTIISKTICQKGGTSTYRGLSKITPNAFNSRAYIDCESLLLDSDSLSQSLPTDEVKNNSSILEHEAFVSSISKSQLYYLMSKGYTSEQARDLIVQGFASSVLDLLPWEYSVELERILFHFSKEEENEKN